MLASAVKRVRLSRPTRISHGPTPGPELKWNDAPIGCAKGGSAQLKSGHKV
jgi:hypothetical protein